MRTYKLYLIRHGLTKANFEGRYIGSTDMDICEEGILKLMELQSQYEYPNVGRVYSSPLKRCVETARLLYPEMTPTVVNDIREYDFGEFENKTAMELSKNKGYNEWISSGQKAGLCKTEAMDSFQERVVNGISDIIKDMMKDKISDAAVVTHAGVISSLLAQCGLPKRNVMQWSVKSGTGYTLLVNTSLWSSAKLAEVFTPIPYGWNKENVMIDYQKQLLENDRIDDTMLETEDGN